MAKLWPPLGNWIRPGYFQLREAVAAHVDFGLVAAIGNFCSIPQEVKRWQAYDLEARMFDAARQRRLHRSGQPAAGRSGTERASAGPADRGGAHRDGS
jgi:hypothetical protein